MDPFTLLFFLLAGFSIAGLLCGFFLAWWFQDKPSAQDLAAKWMVELTQQERDQIFKAGWNAGAAEIMSVSHRRRVESETMVHHGRN